MLTSSAGPAVVQSSPRARCAPAGEKISRPWKVEDKRRADHPRRVGNLPGGHNAIAVGNQSEQTIVRQDEELAYPGLGNDRLPLATHRGIDHHHKNSILGEIGGGAGEKPCPFLNIEGRYLLRDVNNPDSRSNPFHHRLADTHRVVFDVEVGHETNGAQGSLRVCGRQRHEEGEQECRSFMRQADHAVILLSDDLSGRLHGPLRYRHGVYSMAGLFMELSAMKRPAVLSTSHRRT